MAGGLLGNRNLFSGALQAVCVNNTEAGMTVTVNVCNRNAYNVQIDLAVSSSATSPITAEWFVWQATLTGNEVFTRNNLVLAPGQYLIARSTHNGVNVSAWGTWYADDVGTATITINPLNGSTLALAAPSASYIKTVTGTNTDGVYWIKASAAAPAQQVYCIMDSTWDGGGWMIVANNSASTPVFSSTHQPRLTSNPSLVGSSGANSFTYTNNFSINVQDMPINELAWCAFSSNNWKSIFTYSYGRFVNYPRFIPNSNSYTKIFDQYHLTLPWLSATDVRVRPTWNVTPVDTATSFSGISLFDGNRGDTTFGVYSPSVQVLTRTAPLSSTVFVTENDLNSLGVWGIFSWSDVSSAGWDDYQNGNSLGDAWGIASSANYGRGLPSYIMIR